MKLSILENEIQPSLTKFYFNNATREILKSSTNVTLTLILKFEVDKGFNKDNEITLRAENNTYIRKVDFKGKNEFVLPDGCEFTVMEFSQPIDLKEIQIEAKPKKGITISNANGDVLIDGKGIYVKEKQFSFQEFGSEALHRLQRQFLNTPDTKDTVLTRMNIIQMIKDLKELGLK